MHQNEHFLLDDDILRTLEKLQKSSPEQIFALRTTVPKVLLRTTN